MVIPPSPSTLGDLYTRWLNEGREEFSTATRATTASFNLDALKSAASFITKSDCTTVHLIGEGGFNQIFILTFEDGTDIIARLNRSSACQDLAQPPRLLDNRVASEAATLDFVRSKTSIPVPTVLATVADSSNPVGARYLLETRIIGQQLADVWYSMSEDQMKSVVAQVARYEGELLRSQFSSIGSLVTDPITRKPVVGEMGLSCVGLYTLRQDVGPWASSAAYIRAYLYATVDLLENHPEEWVAKPKVWRDINNDSEVHLQYLREWYSLFVRGVDAIKIDEREDPEIPFLLCHEDISKTNILVAYDDPTRVVGIIDWEGAKVVPLWSWLDCDRLLLDDDAPDDQLERLRRLRATIHEEIQPLLCKFKETDGFWSGLLHFASFRVSLYYDIPLLNTNFMDWLTGLPDDVRKSFADLETFIVSEGSGRGHIKGHPLSCGLGTRNS